MARTAATIVLGPGDKPRTRTSNMAAADAGARPNVWVDLSVTTTAAVFPDNAEQADAIAAAFTEAARLMRETP